MWIVKFLKVRNYNVGNSFLESPRRKNYFHNKNHDFYLFFFSGLTFPLIVNKVVVMVKCQCWAQTEAVAPTVLVGIRFLCAKNFCYCENVFRRIFMLQKNWRGGTDIPIYLLPTPFIHLHPVINILHQLVHLL